MSNPAQSLAISYEVERLKAENESLRRSLASYRWTARIRAEEIELLECARAGDVRTVEERRDDAGRLERACASGVAFILERDNERHWTLTVMEDEGDRRYTLSSEAIMEVERT